MLEDIKALLNNSDPLNDLTNEIERIERFLATTSQAMNLLLERKIGKMPTFFEVESHEIKTILFDTKNDLAEILQIITKI